MWEKEKERNLIQTDVWDWREVHRHGNVLHRTIPFQSSQPPAPDTYNLSNKKNRTLTAVPAPAAISSIGVFPFLKFTFGFYSAAMTPVCSPRNDAFYLTQKQRDER